MSWQCAAWTGPACSEWLRLAIMRLKNAVHALPALCGCCCLPAHPSRSCGCSILDVLPESFNGVEGEGPLPVVWRCMAERGNATLLQQACTFLEPTTCTVRYG